MKITVSNKRNKSYWNSLFAGTIGQLAVFPGDIWDNIAKPVLMMLFGIVVSTVITFGAVIVNFLFGVSGFAVAMTDSDWDDLPETKSAAVKSVPKSDKGGEHF